MPIIEGLGGHVPLDDLDEIRMVGCVPILVKGAIWLRGAIAGGAIWDGIKWLADGGDCDGNDAAPCNFPNVEPDEGDDSEEDNEPHGDSEGTGLIDPGWQNLVELSTTLPQEKGAQLVTHSGLCIEFSH